MGFYYSDKKVCFRIRVSFENQNLMTKYIENTFSPVFLLKRDEYYSLKFEHEKFFCSYLKTKQEFLYKDIQKVETSCKGVVIYLKNNRYICISVGHSEKHNTELYDIITFLKRRCRRRFLVKEPISYPEVESDGRYKTEKEPLSQISFSLTDTELKRLLWYDYLFSERMIVFFIAVTVFLLMSAWRWNIGLLIISFAIAVFCLVLSKSFLQTLDGYIENHQGRLQILMFDELLVVRLRYTDLELEYASMRRKISVFGLWRLQCSDFFTFVLPNRVVKENLSFFDMLCAKIK